MGTLGGRLTKLELPLSTPRLSLRMPTLSDAAELSRAGNFRAVARGTFVPHPFGPAEARLYIRRRREAARLGQSVTLLITGRPSGRILGTVGLGALGFSDPRGEVFYWLTPSAWGQGYGTEAVARVLQVAFGDLRLHRVAAHVLAFNDPSVRLLQRFGFRSEGRHREVRKEGRVWHDELAFGLLRAEYLARSRRGPFSR